MAGEPGVHIVPVLSFLRPDLLAGNGLEVLTRHAVPVWIERLGIVLMLGQALERALLIREVRALLQARQPILLLSSLTPRLAPGVPVSLLRLLLVRPAAALLPLLCPALLKLRLPLGLEAGR